MTGHGGLLLVLSSVLSLGAAHNACDTQTWDAVALRAYCATQGQAAYRSPACSVYRLCDNGTTANPPLGAQLCNVSRTFVTLCVDQPGLTECQAFRQQFHYAENYTSCVAAKSFKISSTSAVQSFMAGSCTSGHKMAGCNVCNATACSTQDPLLAYTAACTDMLMSGCEPYIAFCAQETPAAAQLMCLAAKDRTTNNTIATNPAAGNSSSSTAQAPPFASDPCVLDSTQPSCASYTYPDSAANADIAKLCGSMPDMPGCAIVAACEDRDGVAAKYCRPFVLLSTLCADMPGMRGCENYKLLCSKAGSTVAQCSQEPAVPGTPTWSAARTAVFSACADHPMAGCATCSATDCPDPLGSLAGICHEMPNMAVCASFWAFCNKAGADDVAKWCADDGAKYLPSMLMYFHQRTQELLLWKEWRPMTQGQYAGSIIAILAMGVVATALKTFKGALVLRWSHERAMAGALPAVVSSIWLPQRGQALEILIKSSITGVSLTLDYFNMLIAMTFNIGFFCAVIAGYILGTLLFGHVLENYGLILHAERREAARRALGELPPGPMALAGGKAADARAASDEDSEEQFRVVVQDGDCNCVHSA